MADPEEIVTRMTSKVLPAFTNFSLKIQETECWVKELQANVQKKIAEFKKNGFVSNFDITPGLKNNKGNKRPGDHLSSSDEASDNVKIETTIDSTLDRTARSKRAASKIAQQKIEVQSNCNLRMKMRRPTNFDENAENFNKTLIPSAAVKNETVTSSSSVSRQVLQDSNIMPPPPPTQTTRKQHKRNQHLEIVQVKSEPQKTTRSTRTRTTTRNMRPDSDVIIQEVPVPLVVISDSESEANAEPVAKAATKKRQNTRIRVKKEPESEITAVVSSVAEVKTNSRPRRNAPGKNEKAARSASSGPIVTDSEDENAAGNKDQGGGRKQQNAVMKTEAVSNFSGAERDTEEENIAKGSGKKLLDLPSKNLEEDKPVKATKSRTKIRRRAKAANVSSDSEEEKLTKESTTTIKKPLENHAIRIIAANSSSEEEEKVSVTSGKIQELKLKDNASKKPAKGVRGKRRQKNVVVAEATSESELEVLKTEHSVKPQKDSKKKQPELLSEKLAKGTQKSAEVGSETEEEIPAKGLGKSARKAENDKRPTGSETEGRGKNGKKAEKIKKERNNSAGSGKEKVSSSGSIPEDLPLKTAPGTAKKQKGPVPKPDSEKKEADQEAETFVSAYEDTTISGEKTTEDLPNLLLDNTHVIQRALEQAISATTCSGAAPQKTGPELDNTYIVTGLPTQEPKTTATEENKLINRTFVVKEPVEVAPQKQWRKGPKSPLPPSNESLLTEDEEEDKQKKKKKKKKSEETIKRGVKTKPVFSPYAGSPVRKRVAAFEKLGATEKAPGRVTRTKTRNLMTEAKDGHQVQGKTPPNVPKPKYVTPLTNNRLPLHLPRTDGKTNTSTVSTCEREPAPQRFHSALKPPRGTRDQKDEEQKRRQEKLEREEEVRRKKEAMMQARVEEQRKKREEKQQKAQKAREEKEREKEDRLRQAMREKEEKQQEDLRKKREWAAKMLAEQEERKKAEERLKLLKIKEQERLRKLNMKPPPLPTDDCEDSDSSSEQTDTRKKYLAPFWAQKENIRATLLNQRRVPLVAIETFFQVQPTTPDLREIFGIVDERLLKRNSSAVWRTPPKF